MEARVIDACAEASDTSKALGVQARTLEVLDGMGIADCFVAAGRKIHGFNAYAEGARIVHVNLDDLDSPYSYTLSLPQADTERLFAEHLAELGGRVERNVKLVGLVQDGDGVTATLLNGDGRQETSASPRRLRGFPQPACLVEGVRGTLLEDSHLRPKAPFCRARGSGSSPTQQDVDGSLAPVCILGRGERRDVLARRSLREPGGDFAAENTHTLRRVLALAVDDEHAPLATGTHRPKKQLELASRFRHPHSVEIETTIHGQQSAAKLAKGVSRQVHTPAFHAAAVVGDLESGSALDQGPEVLVNCVRFGLHGILSAFYLLLEGRGTLDRLLRNAASSGSIERLHAREKTMEKERFVFRLGRLRTGRWSHGRRPFLGAWRLASSSFFLSSSLSPRSDSNGPACLLFFEEATTSPLGLAPTCADRRQNRLHSGQLPVLVLPIGVRQLRKVVRVGDVFQRQSRSQAARQLEDPAALPLLQLSDEVLDFAQVVVHRVR